MKIIRWPHNRKDTGGGESETFCFHKRINVEMEFYPQEDGEWVQPKRGYRMKCCQCGLVHRMQFRIVEGKVQFRAWREDENSKSKGGRARR